MEEKKWYQRGVIWFKIGITFIGVVLIVSHLKWPELKVDSITIGLFIVSVLPWLSHLFESIKMPGGWEVKFRDVASAGETIPETTGTVGDREASLMDIAQLDANMALVYLRIEIEKRIREIARSSNVNERGPLGKLLRDLRSREVIPRQFVGGLEEVVHAGNNAAHGARVESSLRQWSIDYGPKIINALDEILSERKQDADKQQ